MNSRPEVRFSSEDVEGKIRNSLAEVQLSPEDLALPVVERLERLEVLSKFNEDSRQISWGVQEVFRWLRERQNEYHALAGIDLSDDERRVVAQAALLHDIGKSGPADASREEQDVVIRLFAIENIRDPAQAVAQTVREGWADDDARTRAEAHLHRLGLSPSLTMREFWDHHAIWTRDILEEGAPGLSAHAKVIAASHHIDRGIDPYGVGSGNVPASARAIGVMEIYREALEERLLIAVDKYEAAQRRGGHGHEKALALVRSILGSKYDEDDLMRVVLEAIDALGREGRLFRDMSWTT